MGCWWRFLDFVGEFEGNVGELNCRCESLVMVGMVLVVNNVDGGVGGVVGKGKLSVV